MDVRKVSVDQIDEAAYNPRKDLKPGDAEYQKLKKSIQRFGFVEPLVWNERTGNLVGGHQRFKILLENGETEVDVSVVELDEVEEKALNVALNKIEGDWDQDKLASLLEEISEAGFDATLTGFDADEIDKMLERVAPEEEDAPEYEITEELLESHNYVVLYFDNELDWKVAQEVFRLKSVGALDSKKGYERKGIGRIIRGADVVERLAGE